MEHPDLDDSSAQDGNSDSWSAPGPPQVVGDHNGFLNADELPPSLLKHRILVFCQAKFATSFWLQGMCYDALVDKAFGTEESSHRVLKWDDVDDPSKRYRSEESEGSKDQDLEDVLSGYLISFCENEDSLSPNEANFCQGFRG
mmetsp:Transcript_9538/g.14980  ORF Transcript_9538/g.14980 Transcript_9538/m.14980 type:complete len:143 (+) Transcript_9538:88-516(+)